MNRQYHFYFSKINPSPDDTRGFTRNFELSLSFTSDNSGLRLAAIADYHRDYAAHIEDSHNTNMITPRELLKEALDLYGRDNWRLVGCEYEVTF